MALAMFIAKDLWDPIMCKAQAVARPHPLFCLRPEQSGQSLSLMRLARFDGKIRKEGRDLRVAKRSGFSSSIA